MKREPEWGGLALGCLGGIGIILLNIGALAVAIFVTVKVLQLMGVLA